MLDVDCSYRMDGIERRWCSQIALVSMAEVQGRNGMSLWYRFTLERRLADVDRCCVCELPHLLIMCSDSLTFAWSLLAGECFADPNNAKRRWCTHGLRLHNVGGIDSNAPNESHDRHESSSMSHETGNRESLHLR